MDKRIVFLTRIKPDLGAANYLRMLKLIELYKLAFNQEVEVANFYKIKPDK